MAEQRTLWCAYDDDLESLIPVECTVGESVGHVKERIKDKSDDLHVAAFRLNIFLPLTPIKHVFSEHEHQKLHPRDVIFADQPRSADPFVDLVCVRPKPSDSVSRDRDLSPLLSSGFLCSRDDTVSNLAQALDEQLVIHVRGTPATGKTTLAILLEKYYLDKGSSVFYFDTWPYNLPERYYWGSLIRRINDTYGDGSVPAGKGLSNAVLLIDEAQATYSDSVFWNRMLKDILGYGRNVRVCLFSSYGSPRTGIPESACQGKWTPVRFDSASCVSLVPLAIPDALQIGLFFLRDEFEISWAKACADPQMTYVFEEAARQYIFLLTNGRPGAVKSMAAYLCKEFRSQVKHREISTITHEHVMQALADDHKVFSDLEGRVVNRSFPYNDPKWLTPGAANTLKRALVDGFVPFDEFDEGANICYYMGWLQRVALLDGTDIAVLPSRIHAKYVECYLGPNEAPFPVTKFPTIQALCQAVLQRFSPVKLRQSIQGKVSAGEQIRPVEALYQDEYYRAFSSVVPGVAISSEWSFDGGGRIDFYLPSMKWGIELPRDHSRTDEHCERFLPGGRYHSWISGGMIQEWMIIDCATTIPTEGHPNPRLWRAVFEPDYSQLTILNNNNVKIAGPMVLTDGSQ